MKIKFLEAREVLDGDGAVTQKFRAGQVVELSNASARHWINRGVAEIVGTGVIPPAGPRGPQSESEKARFGGGGAKPAKKAAKKAATADADPTSQGSGPAKP